MAQGAGRELREAEEGAPDGPGPHQELGGTGCGEGGRQDRGATSGGG